MKYFKSITKLFVLALLSFPAAFSIAQTPSASFISGPTITFIQGNSGTTVASAIGQISVSGIDMSDVAIAQGVFNEDVSLWVNDPALEVNSIVMAGSDLISNNGNFDGQIGVGCSSCFPIGTNHYFVFRILNTSSSQPPFPILDSVLIPAVVPNSFSGNNNQPGTTSTNEVVDETVVNGDINWPENVLENTLEVDDLNNFVVGLLNALLKIGIPVLTVFLVYSGLRLVMARGNEKELADAKKNLLWVIIGGTVLFGAWTVVKVLKGTFDEIDLAFINSLINFIV